MPFKCCIYGCTTNYRKRKAGTVYSFPADTKERDRWIQAIPNKNFKWTASKKICRNHWPPNTPTRLARSGSAIPTEPPSVFESVPASCRPTVQPNARKNNSFVERNAKPDEYEAFLQKDRLDFDKFEAYTKDASNF